MNFQRTIREYRLCNLHHPSIVPGGLWWSDRGLMSAGVGQSWQWWPGGGARGRKVGIMGRGARGIQDRMGWDVTQ